MSNSDDPQLGATVAALVVSVLILLTVVCAAFSTAPRGPRPTDDGAHLAMKARG